MIQKLLTAIALIFMYHNYEYTNETNNRIYEKIISFY